MALINPLLAVAQTDLATGELRGPFNLLGYDLNGDRRDTTDRPVGAGRNTGLGPNFATADMRLSRDDRGPDEPLGFDSAFPPRRIQLGLRLSF